jgi:Transposase zinc-ribbon domain
VFSLTFDLGRCCRIGLKVSNYPRWMFFNQLREPLETRPSDVASRVGASVPDEAVCADYLFRTRWANGFVCPACGGVRVWGLSGKRLTARSVACC